MANQETEIDLLKLAKALWHRAWAIVLAMIICGGAAFSYAEFMITPLYQATAMLYINNNAISVGSTKVSISGSDLSTSRNLIDTYAVILKSRTTLEEVIDVTGLPYTYGQLKGMVSASSVDDTEVMQIVTTGADPEEISVITNAMVEVLSDRVATIVEGCSAQVVDYSVAPTSAVSPDVRSYAMKGLLLGFVLSAAVIIVLSLLDNTIRNEDDLLSSYDEIPVLASIPNLLNNKNGYGYGYGYGENKKKSNDEKGAAQ
jgi:capsular polysaccharide biosynthesis protein